MSNTKKKVKKQSSNKKTSATTKKPKRVTMFKLWCIEHGITQLRISEDTKLSIGCIHSTWNDGTATDSTIKLISLVYGINEEKLRKMITTHANRKEISAVKPMVSDDDASVEDAVAGQK